MRLAKGMRTPSNQAGFSMVEMLMTAFILAVGILGLTMLQTMSIRASRGGKSLSSAVMVAEQVMERAEMEGRLSWLNQTNNPSGAKGSTGTDLPNLRYVTLAAGTPLVEYFNPKGGPTNASDPDPLVQVSFYTVTTTRVAAPTAATGQVSDFTFQVQFYDTVDTNNAPVLRTLALTRRIVHA